MNLSCYHILPAWLAFLCLQMRRSCLFVLTASIMALLMPAPSSANLPSSASGEVTETSVKAAFLYRFFAYVEWPPSSIPTTDMPYTIAVMGADELAEKLSHLVAGRTHAGRRIEVRRVGIDDPLYQVHVLYIGDIPPPLLDSVIKRAQQKAVLSVTDHREGQLRPTVINFRLVENRVRFDVSLENAEKSNLKISSRMLGVAYQVKRSGS